MRPIKIIFYIVSAFSTILIGIGAFMFFFPMHPNQVGAFSTNPFPNQTKILNDYLEKNANSGNICVHQFFGRDKAHLFFEFYCGNFKIDAKNEVETVSGLRTYGRVAYNSNFELSSLQIPADGSFYGPSIVRMYPEVAYKKVPWGKQTDHFMSEIRARLENNLAP